MLSLHILVGQKFNSADGSVVSTMETTFVTFRFIIMVESISILIPYFQMDIAHRFFLSI